MTPVHEALEVLDRTLSWLVRDPRHAAVARHLEATLGRWVERGLAAADPASAELIAGLDAWRADLAGLDDAPGEDRATRLVGLYARVTTLREAAGSTDAPVWEVRARLLPDGVAADVVPRAPAAPAAPVGEGAPPPAAAPVEGGEERAFAAPAAAISGEEGDAPAEEGRRGRRERRGRRDRRERKGEGAEARAPREAPAEVAPVEAPVAAPAPPTAPIAEPEPEVRTWPLGHPEQTGRPVAALDGVTDAEVEALAAVGISQIVDLLRRPPVRHERAGERLIPDVPPEGPVILRGAVKARVVRIAGGTRWYELRVGSDRASARCRWSGDAPAEVLALKVGQEIGLAGRYEPPEEGGEGVLYEAEILGVDGRGGDQLPVYGVEGVAEARMRSLVRQALRTYADTLAEHLPPEIVERYKLLSLPQAVREAHFPPNQSRKSRQRMAFDELLQVQLGVALSRSRTGRERGVAHTIGHRLVAQALASSGWSFTDAQEMAFDEIRRDLRRKDPTARLLQGDAGTGKQLVLQAAMLVVCEAQSQVVYIAPDALTAEHRYLFARGFLGAVGVESTLVTAGAPKATLEALKKGETHVVYATPAFLSELPAFRRLGLVIVEEQDRIGSIDLGKIEVEGGARPHLLVTTPTPVPAAFALTLYGHLALTTIPGSPGKGVQTTVYTAEEREQAYAVVRETLAANCQAVFAFPLKRGQEDLLSQLEARRIAEMLEANYFAGARFGLFSGAMSREERYRAYDDFAHRRTDILLATTCVEHGPDIPNAPVMLVEGAQNLDIVRLHRLRAHIAGGFRAGRLLLVLGEDPGPDARHAIDLLLAETDGYQIAELDLLHRGVENVLGEAASDTPGFDWADPVHDRDLLLKTRQEAVRLLAVDPGLRRRVHRALVYLVRARFGEDMVPDAAPTNGAAAPAADTQAARRRRRRRR